MNVHTKTLEKWSRQLDEMCNKTWPGQIWSNLNVARLAINKELKDRKEK